MDSEEMLDVFDETVRKLKIQYDLFFQGVRKLPPSEDRRRLDAMVHELAKTRMRDNALRFRFNTLLGKYNQFKELWARQMRERDEGPLDFRRRQAAYAEADQHIHEREEQRDAGGPGVTSGGSEAYVRVAASGGDDAVKKLHEKISAAHRELGKPAPSLEQVSALLGKQIDSLRSRYEIESVGFRVEVVDGKVKLKAKPLTK